MEGVMMKNQEKYAVAVRKPDHEIEVKVSEYTGIIKNKKIRNMPILRGVFSFIESLVLGMQTLTYSASFFEDEEVDKKKKEPMTEEERRRQEQKEKKQENAMMGGTVVLSIVLAVAVFMMLPYYLSTLFQKVITSQWVIALLEGVIRLVIFIGYVALISLMKDIRRVYMYHGAEHKCINCIEHGMDLTVDNVRKSSRFHKRCGTSFLLIVMLVSILFFMFIRVDSPILRVVLRLLLIPVIAGVSYEFIRLAGRSDNAVVNLLSKPGLWLQGLTTKEPDDEMIEVGIASVEAVFDWKPYVEEITQESLEWIARKNLKISDCQDILNELESVNRMVNYLKKQKIAPGKFTIMWRDYLRMAREEGYDTTDDIVRFPKDLKARHDQLVEVRNQRKDDKRLEGYKKLDDRIKERLPDMKDYFWEDREYMIIPAGTCKELMDEGRTLHHCVGSSDTYMRKMADGVSWILFLRRKSELEKPYYTIEISLKDDHIIQFYSEYDRQPDKETINDVLNRYKRSIRKKKIKIQVPAAGIA